MVTPRSRPPSHRETPALSTTSDYAPVLSTRETRSRGKKTTASPDKKTSLQVPLPAQLHYDDQDEGGPPSGEPRLSVSSDSAALMGNEGNTRHRPAGRHPAASHRVSRWVPSDTKLQSILNVTFNMVNATIGAGVIGLPFALRNAGFGLGIILSCLVGYLTYASLCLLIHTGRSVEITRYAHLAERTLGKFGFYFVNILLISNGLGSMVSYLIIIGDTLPTILASLTGAGIFENRIFVITMTSTFFIFPLLFFKDLGKLTNASMLSVACIPVILFVMIARGFFGPRYTNDHDVTFAFIGDSVFPSIGVMAFAFLSHHTAFMNFLGLSNPTAKRWSITAGLSVLCSLFIALFFAILGYVIFGMDVRDNILNSFPADDIWINLARGLLAFSLFFTYPMQFYPSRSAIDKILGFESEERTPTKRHHYGVTITFYLVILALGCAVRDLGIVYELVGGFCSTCLAYILPASFYLVLRKGQGFVALDPDDERAPANATIPSGATAPPSQTSKNEAQGISDHLPLPEASAAMPLEQGLGTETISLPNKYYDYVSILLFVFGGIVMCSSTGLTIVKMFQ